MFDNNLPPSFAQAIKALSENKNNNHEIFPLKERFKPDTEDETWIRELSASGDACVITQDRLNKGMEAGLLSDSGLIVFFLDKRWVNQKFWDKAIN